MHTDVNECETEDHQCVDVRDCVDTEGGYSCLSSSTITTNIQPTTTVAPRSTIITESSSDGIEPTAIAGTLMPSSIPESVDGKQYLHDILSFS